MTLDPAVSALLFSICAGAKLHSGRDQIRRKFTSFSHFRDGGFLFSKLDAMYRAHGQMTIDAIANVLAENAHHDTAYGPRFLFIALDAATPHYKAKTRKARDARWATMKGASGETETVEPYDSEHTRLDETGFFVSGQPSQVHPMRLYRSKFLMKGLWERVLEMLEDKGTEPGQEVVVAGNGFTLLLSEGFVYSDQFWRYPISDGVEEGEKGFDAMYELFAEERGDALYETGDGDGVHIFFHYVETQMARRCMRGRRFFLKTWRGEIFDANLCVELLRKAEWNTLGIQVLAALGRNDAYIRGSPDEADAECNKLLLRTGMKAVEQAVRDMQKAGAAAEDLLQDRATFEWLLCSIRLIQHTNPRVTSKPKPVPKHASMREAKESLGGIEAATAYMPDNWRAAVDRLWMRFCELIRYWRASYTEVALSRRERAAAATAALEESVLELEHD